MADVITIADAIVARFNDAAFGQDFTAARGYVIVQELNRLDRLRVTVIPSMLSVEAFDLTPRRLFEWSVAIAVQKRLESSAVEFVDPLMALVADIIDLFPPGDYLGDDRRTRIQRVENVPIYDPGMLDTQGLFTSLITITVRIAR